MDQIKEVGKQFSPDAAVRHMEAAIEEDASRQRPVACQHLSTDRFQMFIPIRVYPLNQEPPFIAGLGADECPDF
jgi:hypothetical protein